MNASSGSGLWPRRISIAAEASGRGLPPPEEPALERPEHLGALERLDAGLLPVLFGDAEVVLEGVVGGVERVLELVALEHVVVGPGLVAFPVLRVDGAAHRPDAALLALDPDHDALGRSGVVEPVDDALGEAACLLLSAHRDQDTIALRGRDRQVLRGLFSFLVARSTQEERVAAYVIREHDRGRTLDDILDDPYVRNRLSPPEIARLLDRPDVIKAIGDDMAEPALERDLAQRSVLGRGPGSSTTAAPPRGPTPRARST